MHSGIVVAAVALAGCQGTVPAATAGAPPSARSAVGIVVSVEGTSPGWVERFSLRTEEGRVLVFEVGPLDLSGGGFPAAHLREHQATAAPVAVDYRVEGDRQVATRLRDAP